MSQTSSSPSFTNPHMSHPAVRTERSWGDPSSQDEGNTSDSIIDPALRSPPVQSQGGVSNTLMVDILVKSMHLSPERKKDLEGVFVIGAKDPDAIPRPYLLLALYLLACVFSSEGRVSDKIDELLGATNDGNLHAVLTELQDRLEDSWTLTREQTQNVKVVCQEFIYKAGRTKFKGLHPDVLKRLRQKAELYRLDKVFGRSHRERELIKCVKTTLSTARNNFRQDIARSVYGDKRSNTDRRSTAQKFTNDTVARFNLSETSSPQAYLIQFILLRGFVREQGAEVLDAIDEDAEKENIPPDSGVESDDEEPPKKKQKKNKRQGRVREGEDFWGQVDAWFKEKTEKWGDDFNSPGWKSYIDELVELENQISQVKKSVSSRKDPKGKKSSSGRQSLTASSSKASTSNAQQGGNDWLRNFA